MRPYHLAAPALLLYWQVGPLPHLAVSDSGKVHWAVSGMASSGRWEDATFDCSGNLISADPVTYRDLGARVDIEDPRSHFRVSAAGGRTRQTRVTGSYGPTGWVSTYGAEVGWEGNHAGGSFGFLRDADGMSSATGSLRFGRRDAVHFRLDAQPLSETRLLAGVARTGIGFRHGYAGVVFGPYYERFEQLALFGDVSIPVVPHVEVRLTGVAGSGIEHPQWGIGAGLRLRH